MSLLFSAVLLKRTEKQNKLKSQKKEVHITQYSGKGRKMKTKGRRTSVVGQIDRRREGIINLLWIAVLSLTICTCTIFLLLTFECFTFCFCFLGEGG
jgi:hypothetical protein